MLIRAAPPLIRTAMCLTISAVVGSNYGGGSDGGITVMDRSTNGGGVLSLTGDNIYQAGVMIVSGTLAIDDDDALGNGGPLTFTGQGALQATGDLPLGDTRAIVTPDDPTLAAVIDSNAHSVTVPGLISGPGGLTAVNSGTSGGMLTLSHANTFTGVTTIGQAGQAAESLKLGSQYALQQSTLDTSGPGTLNYNGYANATLGGLQGPGGSSFPLPSGVLTVGGNGFSTTFAGSFTGSGSLAVSGPGELILTNTGNRSNFTNVTTVVNGGILEAASPGALPGYLAGTGNGAVASGTTLAVNLDDGAWQSCQIDQLLQGNHVIRSKLGIAHNMIVFVNNAA